MRFFVFALLIAAVFSSCTMEQHISFNENYGGHYEFSMDFTAMKGFMDAAAEEEGEESTSLTEDMNVDSLVDAMNSRPGITNASVSETDGRVVIGYDFADINSLNMSIADADMSEIMGGGSGMASGSTDGAQVTKKGKKVTFKTGSMKDAADVEDLQGMGSMMNLTVKLTFPDEIKKVKNKNAEISYDRKTVSVSGNLEELLSGEVDPAMTVKLK